MQMSQEPARYNFTAEQTTRGKLPRSKNDLLEWVSQKNFDVLQEQNTLTQPSTKINNANSANAKNDL